MKKMFLGVGIVVVFAFVGCASSQPSIFYDPLIPEDQMSYLVVPNYILVKQFDNKAVHWIAPSLNFSGIIVGVPSGEHTFIVDVDPEGNLRSAPDIRNKSFTMNFQAGVSYQLIINSLTDQVTVRTLE
jgi:hypothetical protein